MSSIQSGTQAATIGTEHTLGSSVTSPGTYLVYVDASTMVAGDVLELRVKMKVLSGGSEKLAVLGQYTGAQIEAIKFPVPIRSEYSVSFTLKQVAGTGRSYDWNIVSL